MYLSVFACNLLNYNIFDCLVVYVSLFPIASSEFFA